MMEELFRPFASDTSFLAALGYSVFGMAVVFAMLWILMLVIQLMAQVARRRQKQPIEATAPVAASPVLAPGSAGSVALYGVPEETAAMLMAIVADEMHKPLNEIRFLSIREVSE